MVRGEKGGSKRDLKRRVKGNEGSDDSDEDYVATDDQSDASEDALEDLARSASEDEIFNDEALTEDEGVNDDDYKEEEEEEEEEEEREEDGGGGDEEENEVVKSEVKWGSSGQRKSTSRTSRNRNRVMLKEEEDDGDEDYDANDDDDADDEEFTPDEDECLEDQEDFAVKKRSRSKPETQKKSGKRGLRKKLAKSGRKRRKKLAAPKSLSRKRGRKIKPARKKARYEDEYEEDNGGFQDKNMDMGERARKTSGRSKRRSTVRSDSDFMSSGSSDHEYTTSEEEREQIREANKFCGNLTDIPTRRSSPSSEKCTKSGYSRSRRTAPSKRTEERVGLVQQRNPPGPKGKQKVEEVNMKQVCGICLSEEDKRRVRGTLNCCSHYFCFSCILEWSKVETRCPLCKQRFRTISKPTKSAAGVDLRDFVMQVQERDQVYQPTEEEIRGYLDPYENVICTECQQGGDDGLMLLCDLCDSPAHSYCVGLGREVPEGNWYCEGCRPGALGSSSSHPEDPSFSDQRAGMNGGDGLDLNVAPSSLPLTQGGGLLSPRFNGVINQATYPSSGTGATTLYDRRVIHRHIQGLLAVNRSNTMSPRTDGVSPVYASSDQLSSRRDQPRQAPMHHMRTPEMRASYESLFGERLQESPSPSMRGRNNLYIIQNTLRRQGVEEPTANPPSNSLGAILLNELGVMDGAIMAHEPFPQSISSRSSLGSEFTASPLALREENHFYKAKEQVQSMVKSHLKSISKDCLGPDDSKNIVRSSTHTILAACGLDHRINEVHTGIVPLPLGCTHPELAASGPTSLMKGLCSACFDGYVRDVVASVMESRSQQWLSLCL